MRKTDNEIITSIEAALKDFALAQSVVARAFDQINKAFQEVGQWLVRAFGGIEKFQRASTIAIYGPDNETGEGVWLSNMCASWLHDSCLARRFCNCHCHHER